MTFSEFVKVYRDNGESAARLCFDTLDFSKIPMQLVLSQIPELSSWWPASGYDWTNYLVSNPENHQYCDWSKLDGWDWSDLLSMQPHFSHLCDWSKLDKLDYEMLLASQPQFSERCTYDLG